MTFWTFYKAGKFAKDWKKSLKIVYSEKNLALQTQSLLWRLNLKDRKSLQNLKNLKKNLKKIKKKKKKKIEEIWGNVQENENDLS